MTPEAVRRYGRQLALAAFGPEAQAAVQSARVVIAGADPLAETAARYLAAAGVGCLRLDADLFEVPGLVASLEGSQPGLRLERLPESLRESDDMTPASGQTFLDALAEATLLLRPTFDDDPWLAAAVRRGVPAVFARATESRIDLLSLRRHGPCSHVPLDRPRQTTREHATNEAAAPELAAALAVVAGTLVASEALRLIGARGRGDDGETAPARLLRLNLGATSAVTSPAPSAIPLAQDIPWSPACFACGGHGTEMSFS